MAASAGRTVATTLGVLVCVPMIFSLAGCGRVWQSFYISGCDRDIRKATQSIETAKSDTQRAAAYADRGDAYAEKARYSRAFKLLSSQSMFDLIESLSDEQRQVLILKFVFDFSNAETAAVLEKSEGAIKSLQHRALASLQKQMK